MSDVNNSKLSKSPYTLDVLIVGLCMMSAGLGQSLIFSVVPIMGRNLGLTEVQVSSVFGFSAIFWMVMSPFWGKLTDKFGAPPILFIGLLGYALSLTSFVTVFNFGINGYLTVVSLYIGLIVTRTINGVIGSAIRPAAISLISSVSHTSVRIRSLSLSESGFTVGMVVGPLIGGLLILISYVLPFYLFGGLGLVLAVLVLVRYRRKKGTSIVSKKVSEPLSILSPYVWPNLVIGLCTGLGNATYTQTIGYLVADNNPDMALPQILATTSFCFAISAAASIFSSWVMTASFFRLTAKWMIFLGIVSMLFSWYLLAVSSTIVVIYIASWALGMGFGLLRSGNVGLLSISVKQSQQGRASGYLGMIVPSGHIFTPFVTIPLYQIDPSYPYYALVALFAALFIFVNLNKSLRTIN